MTFGKCFRLFFAACALSLAGCATSSVIVTGQPRPPVEISAVKLYLEAPQNYEVIGQITASSDSGWTRQASVNYAIEELKKRAAALGANGVVIKNQGSYITGASVFGSPWTGATISAEHEQFFVGLAIYCEEEKGKGK